MMLHVKDAAQQDTSVIIRSPDTDVFLLLLAFVNSFSGPIYMDTGSGDHHRIIDIGKIQADIGDDVSKALLDLHAFTGSDTTSAFMRNGKIRPFKIMQGNDQYINAFKKLGETEEVPSDVCEVLEEFTCSQGRHLGGSGGGQLPHPRLKLPPPPPSLNLPPTSPKPQEVTAAGFPLFLRNSNVSSL